MKRYEWGYGGMEESKNSSVSFTMPGSARTVRAVDQYVRLEDANQLVVALREMAGWRCRQCSWPIGKEPPGKSTCDACRDLRAVLRGVSKFDPACDLCDGTGWGTRAKCPRCNP